LPPPIIKITSSHDFLVNNSSVLLNLPTPSTPP
jgi:hypothetical protein